MSYVIDSYAGINKRSLGTIVTIPSGYPIYPVSVTSGSTARVYMKSHNNTGSSLNVFGYLVPGADPYSTVGIVGLWLELQVPANTDTSEYFYDIGPLTSDWDGFFVTGYTEFNCSADGAYTGNTSYPVNFYGSASNGEPPYSFYWDFGDGGTSPLQNPTHQYTAEGTYNVTLTVTDNTGATCIDSTTATISEVQNYYDFNASANPSTYGYISGTANGSYVEGTIISVTANAYSGYEFVKWTASGITLSDEYNPDQTFSMPAEDVTLVAQFQPVSGPTYAFNASASPPTYGYISGTANGNYEEGIPINVTAYANTGYEFISWTANGITLADPSNPSQAFSMPAEDVTLVANFQIIAQTYSFSASASPSTYGYISGTANGNYEQGEIISVTAYANTGYEFVNWGASGITLSDPSNPSQAFSMPANTVTLTAYFQVITQPTYAFSASTYPPTYGSINGTANGDYEAGTTISVSAVANTGYEFTYWTAVGITLTDIYNPSQAFSMPANDVTLIANFQIAGGQTYSFIASAIPAGYGYISGTPNGYYEEGTLISVTAIPNTGYEFLNWTAYGITITDPTNPSQSFSMPASNVLLEANFQIINCPLYNGDPDACVAHNCYYDWKTNQCTNQPVQEANLLLIAIAGIAGIAIIGLATSKRKK